MNEYLTHIRSFTHNARLFLLVMGILAFGTAPSTLFLNIYFQALGADRAFIGLATTVIQLGGALTILPAAFLLDKIGRRLAVIIGGYGSTLAWLLAVIIPDQQAILLLLMVNGAGTGLFGLAVVPLLAESSTARERTTLFSVYEGLTTLMLFVGSVISGFLPMWIAPFFGIGPESPQAYRMVLLISAAIRMVGLLPLVLLQEHPMEIDPAATPSSSDVAVESTQPKPARPRIASYFNPRNLLRLRTPMLLYGIPVFLVYAAGSLIFPFLPLFLKERFAASDGAIGTVQGLINLSIGVGSLLAPVAVTRLGRAPVVVFGALASALALGVIGFTAAFLIATIAIVARAGIFNMILPLYRAHVIDHAPKEEYTIVALLLALSANIGPAITPSISGLMQREVGFGPVFILAMSGYALAALCYAIIFKFKGKRS